MEKKKNIKKAIIIGNIGLGRTCTNTMLYDCAKDEPTKCPKCKGKSLVKYRDGKQCSFCLHIV